jgi:hypothetical protein
MAAHAAAPHPAAVAPYGVLPGGALLSGLQAGLQQLGRPALGQPLLLGPSGPYHSMAAGTQMGHHAPAMPPLDGVHGHGGMAQPLPAGPPVAHT